MNKFAPSHRTIRSVFPVFPTCHQSRFTLRFSVCFQFSRTRDAFLVSPFFLSPFFILPFFCCAWFAIRPMKIRLIRVVYLRSVLPYFRSAPFFLYFSFASLQGGIFFTHPENLRWIRKWILCPRRRLIGNTLLELKDPFLLAGFFLQIFCKQYCGLFFELRFANVICKMNCTFFSNYWKLLAVEVCRVRCYN